MPRWHSLTSYTSARVKDNTLGQHNLLWYNFLLVKYSSNVKDKHSYEVRNYLATPAKSG